MPGRAFGNFPQNKSASKICDEEQTLILKIEDVKDSVEKAILCWNAAREAGWRRAEEKALLAWRASVLIELAKIRAYDSAEKRNLAEKLYAYSPSRTPERTAALAYLRSLHGERLRNSEILSLQKRFPKLSPRLPQRSYACYAWAA